MTLDRRCMQGRALIALDGPAIARSYHDSRFVDSFRRVRERKEFAPRANTFKHEKRYISEMLRRSLTVGCANAADGITVCRCITFLGQPTSQKHLTNIIRDFY